MNSLNFQKNKSVCKMCFTITENLIVLGVLIIILSLVLPELLRDKKIENNRILVRNAVVDYQNILMEEYSHILKDFPNKKNSEVFFNKILTKNNCEKISSHFVNVQKSCKFSSDNLKWDVSNPSYAIIALNDENPTNSSAKDMDNTKVFYISYAIKNGKILILSNNWGNNNFAQKTRKFIIGE